MKTVHTRSKTTQLLSYAAASVFVLAGCSSDDDIAQIIDDEFITASGRITDINDVAEPDVRVEGVYANPGDVLNPATTTDANGNFSLQLLNNNAFYLQASKDTFATINSEKVALSVNVVGLDIGMPTVTEAEAIIDAAFPTEGLAIVNHAWLAVDIEDENGNEVGGETITSSVTPSGFAYTNCDGTNSVGSVTIACTDREGPMYIAYFDAAADATVTANGQTKTAPLRTVQLTVLEYEIVSSDESTAFERGAAYYDAYCTECHSAGSYDIYGTATNLLGTTIIQELSSYPSMGNVADLTVEQQADLQAFVTDPSLL